MYFIFHGSFKEIKAIFEKQEPNIFLSLENG